MDKPIMNNLECSLLENTTLHFLKLNKDPTNKFPKQIDNTIKNNLNMLYKDNKFRLIMDNPCLPNLNTVIKLHKL